MTDRRYRVLAVASHPVQYMAPLFRRMAQHAQLDFQVAYCSLRGAEPGADPEFGATVQWDVPLLEGYRWTQIANRGSGKESFFGLRNPELRGLIRGGQFDAVLCYVGYVRASFWIAYRAARASGAAFLFGTDATTLDSRDGRGWKVFFKRILWPRLFSLADQVMVPSSGTQKLVRSLGIAEERITLTPYCVDNEWWMRQSALADREAVRTEWGATAESAVILFCAKLQVWKRPHDLLRAFEQAKLPNALLVFAGEGALRAQLDAEAARLGVQDRVRFLGFVNQSRLPALYAAADLMVLPSSYEPFAVVVNEAMCCGCPVMVSDQVGAAQDLVAPVAPEFVFHAGDAGALAEKLRLAVSERGGLGDIARAGLTQVRMWSPERNIAATFEAIERATSRIEGAGARRQRLRAADVSTPSDPHHA